MKQNPAFQSLRHWYPAFSPTPSSVTCHLLRQPHTFDDNVSRLPNGNLSFLLLAPEALVLLLGVVQSHSDPARSDHSSHRKPAVCPFVFSSPGEATLFPVCDSETNVCVFLSPHHQTVNSILTRSTCRWPHIPQGEGWVLRDGPSVHVRCHCKSRLFLCASDRL